MSLRPFSSWKLAILLLRNSPKVLRIYAFSIPAYVVNNKPFADLSVHLNKHFPVWSVSRIIDLAFVGPAGIFSKFTGVLRKSVNKFLAHTLDCMMFGVFGQLVYP